VMIKWSAPAQRNGKLLGYQLYILYSEESEQKTSVINITDDRTNIFQITGLSKILSVLKIYVLTCVYTNADFC